MDVSIIFVNYKTKDLTINAINSVKEKTEDIEYEIFVVDNASNDGSIEAIEQQFPNINIIKSDKNGGFGYANNLAIKQAKGKYILCLNTDTLLINNAIKIMFDYMEENKNTGACGGILHDNNLKPIHSGGLLPSLYYIFWKLGLRYIFPRYYKTMVGKNCIANTIEYICGADIFFRKSVLDEVGLFDENIFMYFEDSDLCKRIIKSGYGVKLVPNAKIIHLEGQSIKMPLAKQKSFKKSEFYYFQKHYPYQKIIIKFIYLLLYFIDGYILHNENSKELLEYVWSRL